MIQYAEKLAEDISCLRLGIYLTDGKNRFFQNGYLCLGRIYEITTKRMDKTLGEMLILPSEKVLG